MCKKMFPCLLDRHVYGGRGLCREEIQNQCWNTDNTKFAEAVIERINLPHLIAQMSFLLVSP
jgi:hypothetical protein